MFKMTAFLNNRLLSWFDTMAAGIVMAATYRFTKVAHMAAS
jgi:hypothetical protein